MRRDQPAGFSGTGPSRTVDQSASSSSARIIARPVCDPWPISDLSTVRVTMPSVPTRSHALGAKPGPAAAGSAPAAAGPGFAPNAWLRVGTDGIVTLTVDKSEMGQGSQTGLAMILAEELEADWSTVRLGPVPENAAGWSRRMSTGGSNAIRSSWEPLRKAGATAREMLVTAAAQTWQVDRATCRAEQGAVIHVPSGRRLSYGTLDRRAAKIG